MHRRCIARCIRPATADHRNAEEPVSSVLLARNESRQGNVNGNQQLINLPNSRWNSSSRALVDQAC